MRIKTNTVFYLLISFFLLVLIISNTAYGDNYSNFIIPKPDQAKDIHYHTDEIHKAQSLTFKLVSARACEEVLTFYNKELALQTLEPFSEDGVGDGTWRDRNNQETSFKSDSSIRFIKSWVDKEHTIRFFLTIVSIPESKNSTLCSSEAAVFDFYSLSSLQSFFDSLTKQEKNRLLALTSHYTDTSGTVDINSALRDNPEDQLLRKFADFLEEQQVK